MSTEFFLIICNKIIATSKLPGFLFSCGFRLENELACRNHLLHLILLSLAANFAKHNQLVIIRIFRGYQKEGHSDGLGYETLLN